MWIWAFAVPIAVDVFSGVLGVRKATRSHGASGIPILTVPLYGLAGYGLTGSLGSALAILAAGAVFHAIVVFGVPMLLSRLKTSDSTP